jgi:hypothetical protein
MLRWCNVVPNIYIYVHNIHLYIYIYNIYIQYTYIYIYNIYNYIYYQYVIVPCSGIEPSPCAELARLRISPDHFFAV